MDVTGKANWSQVSRIKQNKTPYEFLHTQNANANNIKEEQFK